MILCFTRFSAAVLAWHGILLTVSGHLGLPLSARSQGQTTIAIVGKSGKRTRLTLREKLEALRMLESGSLLSAVMCKFGVSSRFVTKLKSEGAQSRRR